MTTAGATTGERGKRLKRGHTQTVDKAFVMTNYSQLEPLMRRRMKELRLQALRWLLEEIHVTWVHLEKKQTRLRLYTKSLEETRIQYLGTASRLLATMSYHTKDGIRKFKTVLKRNLLKEALEDSARRRRQKT
ncbi:hypothetical protein Tco_1426222 [Tanacetum coccineum]